MSNRLGGFRNQAYRGTNADQPPNMHFEDRAPTSYDTQASIGDFWIDSSAADANKLWVLVSLQGSASTKGESASWIQLGSGGGSGVNTLTGNSGGAVPPTANNINVVGDGTTANVVGTPGTSTLTISASASVPIQFDADTGSAVPVLGVLNVFGADGIATSGAGNTVTIGTNGTIANQYDTDSGSAIPAGGILNVLGGSNINTTGAGDTVTVNLNDYIEWPASSATSGIIYIDGFEFMSAYGTNNTFLGNAAGNLTLNTGSAIQNTGIGTTALLSLTTGASNTALGGSALGSLTTGSSSIGIGLNAGVNYTTESSNICIANDGTVADANTLRIGTEGSGIGEIDTTFIAGIYNTTGLTGTRMVVVDANGQLGTDTAAGPVTYSVQTTDATPTTIFNQTIAEGEAVDVSCLMIAAVPDYSEGLAGKLNGGARRETGMSTTIIGSPIVDYSEDITGSPTFTLTTSGNDVIIQVTGVAATTINWKASVTILLLDA
jgi:hypothetical protein